MIINDEYCWMHQPGGWTCAECRYTCEPITILAREEGETRRHVRDLRIKDGVVTACGLGYYRRPAYAGWRGKLARLAQHCRMPVQSHVFVLTHLRSGMSFGVGLVREEDVRAWLEAIADMVDWQRSEYALREEPDLETHILSALSEITVECVLLRDA